MTTRTEEPVIRLGVSACLLGEQVRYDGGHKRDLFLLETLGRFVEWVPVCPEVEIGLGIPRESVRLVETDAGVRMIAPKSGKDHTEKMESWAAAHMAQLERARLHGFVLKKDSPSCGLFRVKIRRENGYAAERNGRGLFARELVARFRFLPVEEEGRLHDMPLRENFIERVFAYQRWLRLLEDDPTPRGLVAFHTVHKLTILSHSPDHYRKLGRLVARAGRSDWAETSERYGETLMEALSVLTTKGRHVNVLQHLAGFVKAAMSRDDREELAAAVADYRAGHVPLVVPLTLLRHHLRGNDAVAWATSQVYLSPYPKELMLRNHC
jgi:uncharacterized protein YbgA (DUF1722 family)/uncharacterized protein YbbK (DUF523 family)